MGHEGMGMDQDMMDMMGGMPDWLVMTTVLALIAISIVLVAGLNMRRVSSTSHQYWTFDLLRIPLMERFVKSRLFQFSLQLPVVLLFLFIIITGLFGNQLTAGNAAPLITWTIWWAGLILIILILGKFWCVVCPWNALAQWIERLSLWKAQSSALSLGLKWPVKWRNIYLATGLFIGLTWLELGYGITFSPRMTAYFAIMMIVMAVVSILIFERQSFCRYACLVGRVSGMYSLFSPLELRSRDRAVCKSCHTNDCVTGNEHGYGCPTSQYLGTMDTNTYCILCSECVKTCPHDNVAVNVRPFGADLKDHTKGQADEAYLVIVMLCMTVFHGLTMTPAWGTTHTTITQVLGIGYLGAFSLGMVFILLLPAALYTGTVWIAQQNIAERLLSMKQVFVTFAYPFLPVALFYHMAHNAEHFFMEGQKLIALASDPFGWGWNLLGTANMEPTSLLHLSTIWWIQAGLIVVGQAAAVAILISITRRLFPNWRQAIPAQVPFLLLILACSFLNVWLTSQPMMMRTGM
jgi:polyferredoxin